MIPSKLIEDILNPLVQHYHLTTRAKQRWNDAMDECYNVGVDHCIEVLRKRWKIAKEMAADEHILNVYHTILNSLTQELNQLKKPINNE